MPAHPEYAFLRLMRQNRIDRNRWWRWAHTKEKKQQRYIESHAAVFRNWGSA